MNAWLRDQHAPPAGPAAGFRLIQMPKTASTTLTAYLGVKHEHRRAREIASGEILVGVNRGRPGWTRSFHAHIRRWADESDWAMAALTAIGRGSTAPDRVLWGVYDLRGVELPPLVENRCRITTIDANWGSSRAHTFFGPLYKRTGGTAHEAHRRWWFNDSAGNCLIDHWIEWSQVRSMPMHLNRTEWAR